MVVVSACDKLAGLKERLDGIIISHREELDVLVTDDRVDIVKTGGKSEDTIDCRSIGENLVGCCLNIVSHETSGEDKVFSLGCRIKSSDFSLESII